MYKICEEEIKYIISFVDNGGRIDLRKFNEERKKVCINDVIVGVDGSTEVRLGNTRTQMSVYFKSTNETVKQLVGDYLIEQCGLLNCNLEINNEVLEFKFIHNNNTSKFFIYLENMINNTKNDIFNMLREEISKCGLGIVIEFNVISDDGNLWDAFFMNLEAIFSNIKIPNIKNLNSLTEKRIQMPQSISYGIFNHNQIFLKDPSLLEEYACDGIIHIVGNKLIFTEGQLDFNVVTDFLNSLY